VAIANALQLEAARRFNYDAMQSLKSLNLSAAVLQHFCCWYITLRCELDLWPLTLNMCSVSPVTWWNSVTTFERNLALRLNYSLFRCWYVMSRCDTDLWPGDHENSWHIKRHVIKVCTKFERNRAIPGWIIDNFANFCTRYVTPWPWPLTS